MNELFTKDEALKNLYIYFDSLKKLVKSVAYHIENEFDLNEVLICLKFRKEDYNNINSIDVFKNLDLLKHYNSIDSLDIFKDEFNSINTIYNYYHNLENPLIKVDNKGLKNLIFEISIKLKGLDNYYSDSINNDSNYSHNVFVNLKPDNLNIIDYSDVGAKEKVIALNELGILDYLQKEFTICQTSTNKIAEVLSLLTGEKSGTIQSYINPMINEGTSQKNNPYSNINTVEKTKNKLNTIGVFKSK